ncbi:ABC transporter [Streptomyces sp. Li-HN-5-11]|uniref:ABC transporter n=1 Tax=Streptomyces sp. Li-HN-5-11 TaxID=3075432 RepID=UPI0028A8B94E|nr:ABC transporter [Streptomyces sp. Li-HN-5-11]WNM36156.1 ABC transporter [Streptomyces sp. Li-HN-5-11]
MREVTQPRTAPPSRSRTVIAVLARPVWHSLPWRALAAAGGLGLLAAASTRLPGQAPGPGTGLALLRLTALAGGLGLAFLLDDPARHTTAALPVGRPVRAWLRLALVAPLLVPWWATALLLVPAGARPPAGPVTLEAAGTAGAALALAAASVRFSAEPLPGRATAAALGRLAVAALVPPRRWSLLVTPGDPNWAATHRWWAALLAAALATWAVCAPEPLRRRSAGSRPAVRSPCGT